LGAWGVFGGIWGFLGSLGILGIENRKLKIEKNFSFSKPATTTKKNLFLFLFFNFLIFFCVRADAVFTASADGKNPSTG
jgi:hypothetical protein